MSYEEYLLSSDRASVQLDIVNSWVNSVKKTFLLDKDKLIPTSSKMLTAANMYPWYRDSMSQLGQFCAGNNLSSAAATIKTENGYNDCMLALDYAHNKVSLLRDIGGANIAKLP